MHIIVFGSINIDLAGRVPHLPRAGETIPASEAHKEIERRLARSPQEVARQLAQVYGHEFPEAVYIPGSIIAHSPVSSNKI